MKLYYFDCYGRVENTRIMLNYAKVQFEDIRIDYDKFSDLKKEGVFEFGFAPSIEIDGERYCQSYSILRMLGKDYGFYPEDDKLAWEADSII